MAKLLQALLVLLAVTEWVSSSGVGVKWSYKPGPNGPENWYRGFATCKGQQQSPINIETSKAVKDDSLTPFEFIKYTKRTGIDIELENNGHSAKVNVRGKEMKIKGGGLPGTYTVLQYHFHWGSNNGQGSEHTVNGKQYPLEMHIVHTRDGVEHPLDKPQGLAVLGILFEIGSSNSRYKRLFKWLKEIKKPGSKYELNKTNVYALKYLLPENTEKYWRYNGGLTTPGCYESVIWTVFQTPIKISVKQLEELRALQQEYNHVLEPLVDNFRPVQDLSGRRVLKSA